MTRRSEALFVLALIVLGVAARLLAARGPLMPDEAWHVEIARAPSLAAAYRASLDTVHPPLFMFVLHFWKGIARSDWQLRALSVLFAVPFLWAAYRWVGALFGRAAGLSAAALFAFLPSLVLISGELRGYGLLLCLLALCLNDLERGLEAGSLGLLLRSVLFGGLALLTHYGAAFVLLAAFVYAAARLRSRSPGRRVVGGWLLAQALVAAGAVALYATHISRMRGGRSDREARTEWLKESFFRPSEESAPRFLARQTLAVLNYVFSTRAAALVALALLVVALVALARRGRWAAIALLVVPFAATAAAGLVARYPYGGTRHNVALALFACAGTAFAAALVTRERPWVAILMAVGLLPAAFALGL